MRVQLVGGPAGGETRIVHANQRFIQVSELPRWSHYNPSAPVPEKIPFHVYEVDPDTGLARHLKQRRG